MRNKLAPSLLAADFSKLESELQDIADAHYLHLDVMDGHFVPNISFGAPVIRRLRPLTGLIFDVHLMISHPLKYLEMFAEAGADILNVHVEARDDIAECIKKIRALSKRAAVTVKPETPVEAVFPYLGPLDMALIMSVEPGFGGQPFMPEALRKAETLASYATRHGLEIDIEMDGGIDVSNVSDVLNAGVSTVVAGSAVFGKTREETRRRVREFLHLMG
ncbi:MAG: ribulose-phosphate 3-epimerase [Clostridiales bacterium]|jgi:ribulose-phosphate 3-epimerase|nr:ribulose-phosphate 3-epimerase [Clostridiales bacterium]